MSDLADLDYCANMYLVEIEEGTGYKNAEPMALDLGKWSSISEFATQASKTLDRLDILVENAAVATPGNYVPTEDGWETMLQVNSLGPAMHVLLLLPIIMNTAKVHSVDPRIVVVSSGAALSANIGSDAMAAPNTLEMLSSKAYCKTEEVFANRYHLSKMLNVMLVRKLAEHLPQNIVPVTLSPGFCVSGLRRWAVGEVAEQFKKMEDESAYTSEEGSRHIIYSAIGGKDKELRGAFMSYLEPVEISAWMLSDEGKKAEDKTWVEMIELFGKLDDRIPGIVAQYLKA
ncbi:NAD(P)-binding protein [Gymnopus androsaceus JB14]|uniref:NAD(P)-binding protein n=1 Tax=Gymnopus androsaceus JB14 TaxID=1447944 RepID=A0A6A4H283_9AGAR|nr:NAD(P)-binding protein [Gymnopus androsaceus JB14]